MNKHSTTIKVGIAGLGRSGWSIHAEGMKELTDLYQVAAVTDPWEQRRQEAEELFGCRSYAAYEELLADEEVELVVVATPSHLHAEHARKAFATGRDVVCEKPLAASLSEADAMIADARKSGRVLAPFQNRRYEPAFRKVREVIESGKLGRIVQIRLALHGFSRRWDWQTLKEYGGGTLNNTGPHFMDQALELFGPGEPEVYCHLDRALTSGDADDHMKVILRGPDAPLVEVEITAACPYPQEIWLVMGTQGGLKGSGSRLDWKYVDLSALPARPVDRTPTPDRSYNHEPLEFTEEHWEADPESLKFIRDVHSFYRDLYQSLRDGKPLVITPESVRRQIAVLERCHELCPL